MCALKSVDCGVSVVVGRDRDVVLSRLGDPPSHRKGGRCRRDHAPRPVGGVAAVADEASKQNISNSRILITKYLTG